MAAVGAKTASIEPGSPWENSYGESFNSKLRDELLDGEVFYSLAEAKVVIESWWRHDNTTRPHSALGYRPPAPEVVLWPARPTTQTVAPKPVMHEHSARTTSWGPANDRGASRMPARKSATSLGVEGPLRDEAMAAAERVGMPVGQWLERAVRKALDEGIEPAQPDGVELGELEAMVRRVVAEELEPVKEALVRAVGKAASSPTVSSSPIRLMRERRSQRRAR